MDNTCGVASVTRTVQGWWYANEGFCLIGWSSKVTVLSGIKYIALQLMRKISLSLIYLLAVHNAEKVLATIRK